MNLTDDPDGAVDPVSDDDQAQLKAIMAADDPVDLASRIYTYYHDADRADRTSRSQMYLHMGMLAGAVMRVVDDRKTP